MFDVKDSCLKQLEAEGGEAPPRMVEVEVVDDLAEVVLLDVLDLLGYRVKGTGGRRDVIDVHTGEVVVENMHVFDAADASHLARHERGRAQVLVEALANVARNPLLHAGADTRNFAEKALEQYEREVGDA